MYIPDWLLFINPWVLYTLQIARPSSSAALAALEDFGISVMSMETLTSGPGQAKLKKASRRITQ
jgi:hypothetical protein